MANRRMLAKSVINQDFFLDMDLETQALYFHLVLEADDDGFVSPKRVIRKIGANSDSLQTLIDKQFVIEFDSKVVVIRHWHSHNYIQSDRYTPTPYREEFQKLKLIDSMYTLCIHDVSIESTQASVGKSKVVQGNNYTDGQRQGRFVKNDEAIEFADFMKEHGFVYDGNSPGGLESYLAHELKTGADIDQLSEAFKRFRKELESGNPIESHVGYFSTVLCSVREGH